MGGTGKLVSELEKLMLRHEIKIIKNCDVKRINQKGNKVISIDTEDNGNFSADNIVLPEIQNFVTENYLVKNQSQSYLNQKNLFNGTLCALFWHQS